ncbi:peptidase S8/S53 domain-containing protein [Syncephalis fuscata]|nr:peptidase S8/S53 domain-containing protein [Syncephalis fuscata]KAI9591017.1 peptidase S8/S53 domain-containing protein [Syncephalis fuscata]
MKSILLIASIILHSTAAVNGAISNGHVRRSENVTSELLDQINNGYIVKLRSGFQANHFVAQSRSLLDGSDQIEHMYNVGGFEGFAGKLTEEEVERLQNDERVEYIEPQTIMHTMGQQSNAPSWGLSRISSRQRSGSPAYNYPDTAGEGITVWVIDGGIDTKHPDFGGRASQQKNFIRYEPNADLDGHGTHVAGTIGSSTYGVAKKAAIIGLKVFDKSGSGADAGIIGAIQYATRMSKRNKAVMNLSLGGTKSRALNDAVNAAARAGIAVIVAAGNDHVNACRESPASASGAFTVASSDSRDRESDFSNYGSCTRLYAPGTDIVSLKPGGGTDTMSGTSMSAPHVAGVAALYLSARNFNSINQLYQALVDNATPNVLSRLGNGSANKLLYNQL